jgi:hypothetical protein
LGRIGKEVMRGKKLRVKRIKPKQNTYRVISANDFLASDPIDETRQGIPSHFQATLDQLEQLYDGLQLHYGNERLGKKWKLK